MPVDTRDKRSSVLLHSLPFARVLPLRDGSVGGDDFEPLALAYRGIQAAPPAAGTLFSFEKSVFRFVFPLVFPGVN